MMLRRMKVEEKKKSKELSVISQGTGISGDISSEGEVHFEGALEGNIKAAHIIIGPHGRVSGMLAGDYIEVYGIVVGDISGNAVLLGSTARVNGNITQAQITIEPGAVVEGRCHRIDDPIPAEQGPEDLMITDERKKKEK